MMVSMKRDDVNRPFSFLCLYDSSEMNSLIAKNIRLVLLSFILNLKCYENSFYKRKKLQDTYSMGMACSIRRCCRFLFRSHSET